MTHVPTGIVASIRENKSQLRNKERAWQLLCSRVADYYEEIKSKTEDATRKKLCGRGFRSEKIRTYNFPDDRLTDHRINYTTHNLQKILDGHLEELIGKLKELDDCNQ